MCPSELSHGPRKRRKVEWEMSNDNILRSASQLMVTQSVS